MDRSAVFTRFIRVYYNLIISEIYIYGRNFYICEYYIHNKIKIKTITIKS